MKEVPDKPLPLRIDSIHFHADRKLEHFIEEKLRKLKRFSKRIDDVQVILKLDHNKGVIKDKIVEIRLHVPGKTLFAEQRSKAFEESVEFAVDSLVRQVKKHQEKIRQ